jgi:hypothetical protein
MVGPQVRIHYIQTPSNLDRQPGQTQSFARVRSLANASSLKDIPVHQHSLPPIPHEKVDPQISHRMVRGIELTSGRANVQYFK